MGPPRKDLPPTATPDPSLSEKGRAGASESAPPEDITERKLVEAERDELLSRERESRAQLEALSRRLVDLQEQERRWLARELHDEVGQLLTGLQLLIEGSGAADTDEMLHLVEELHRRVRSISADLRPPMLDELGLLPALRWHLERYSRQTGVRVDFTHDGLDRRLGCDLETAAFRIVQEALTNVARHARVLEARVVVAVKGTRLTVEVCDAGVRFDVDRALRGAHGGIAGMQERARLLGGRLTVESATKRGTRVTVELPLSVANGQEPGR